MQKLFRYLSRTCLGLFGILLFNSILAGTPVFQITPSTTTINVANGGTASVTYTIRNLSGILMPMMRYFPPLTTSISVASTCGTTLEAAASCELVLTTPPPANVTSFVLGPLTVCGFGGKICSSSTYANRVTELINSAAVIFVGNNGASTGNTVSLIDTSIDEIVGSPIAVGTAPFGVAISPNGNTAYVTNNVSNTVSVINATTKLVTNTISLPGGFTPRGIAVAPNGLNAYVVNDSGAAANVSVISTATNTVTSTISLGGGGPSAQQIAITPDGTKAYVTLNGTNRVAVINLATNTVITSIVLPGASGARGIAITPDGTKAYVTISAGNAVAVIDTATNTLIGGTIAVGFNPLTIGITPDGTKAYVSGNTVRVIDTATNTVTASVALIASGGITFSTDGTKAYIAGGTSGTTVSVVDTATNTVSKTITGFNGPFGIAITP